MGNDYFSQYKSPNILIVPTISFIKESPVKIMSCKKASVHNESVKIKISNSEIKEKNNQQLLSEVSDGKTQNRSWASNHSQTIGQSKDKTEQLRSMKRKKELEETEKKLIQLPKKLKKDCKSREDSKSNVDVLSKSNSYKVDLTNNKGVSNTSRSKTGVSKISAKYDDDLSRKCQKEIVQHVKQRKSVKSIVKSIKNFQNADKKHDLRLRLKRKLEHANDDDKIKKEIKSSVRCRDFSKFKRDHLFVTIQNERNDTSLKPKDNKNASIYNNRKNSNLVKVNDLVTEKNKTKSPKKLKSNKSTKDNTIKKIQLIINVTYTKQETSPPRTVNGDDKFALATEDLSFLDDFNVDEIVDSLKKCENESSTNETYNSNNYVNLFNEQESKQTNVISNVTVGTNKISNSDDIYSEITRKLAAFDAVKTFSSTRIRNDIANILIDERTIENQPNNITKMDGETKKFVAPLKQYHVKQEDKLTLQKISRFQLDKAPKENNIAKASSLDKKRIHLKNETFPQENKNIQLGTASRTKTRIEEKNKEKENIIVQIDKLSLKENRIKQIDEASPVEYNIAQLDKVCLKNNLIEHNNVSAKEKKIAKLVKASRRKNKNPIEENKKSPKKNSSRKTRSGQNIKTLPNDKKITQLVKASLTKIRIEKNKQPPATGTNIDQLDQASLKKNLTEQKNKVLAKEKNTALLDEAPVKKARIEQKNEMPSKEKNTVQLDDDSLKKSRIGRKDETLTKEKRNSQFSKVSLAKTRTEQNNEAPPIRNNIAQIDKVCLKKNVTEQKNDVSAKKKSIAQVDEVPPKKNRIEQKNEAPPKENDSFQSDKDSLKKNQICGKNLMATLNENNNVQLYNATLKEKHIEQKDLVPLIEKNTAQTDKAFLMENQIKQKSVTPPKESNVHQVSLKENETKHDLNDLNKNNNVQIASLVDFQIELKKEDKKGESLVKLDQIEQRETLLKLNQFKQINNVQLTENLIKKINKVSLNENINDHKKNLNVDITYTNNTTQETPKTVEILKENSTDKIFKTREVPIKLQILENNFKTEEQEENKKQLLDSCLDTEETCMIQDIGKRLHQKYSVTNIVHRGTFSRILQCKNSKGKSYIFKVLRKKCDTFLLGMTKYKMLKSIQKGIPVDNYNIVGLFESCYILNHWCFVMDYYPKNLGQLLEKVDLDIHQVQTLARQLVTAVTVLRNNGILHSDIKPNHILIDETNEKLKLCGFDRAMYIHDVVLTKYIGTINYRAPEVIMGYSAGFGIDVWSTAVVLYEMVTKRQLFPGEDDNDILYKQMCTLGELPWDMVEDSYYGCEHFYGSKFMRKVGFNRKRIIYIPKFFTSNRLKNTLLLKENINWSNAKSDLETKEILAKLNMFHKLLQQMLALHPRRRLPIELVYLNPFIYKMSSDED